MGARMRVTEEELTKPVTRVLHDHVLGIPCLAFHPTNPTLFSGSLDKAVKIFDLTRPPGHKGAFSVLQDVHTVRCISIHPCGDFLLVGTAHQAVRYYDLQTLNCFTTFNQSDHHGSGVNDVRCTSDGRLFASASSDGAIHIWDAISHRIVNRLPKAHSASAVTSVRWSRNLRYLLSSVLMAGIGCGMCGRAAKYSAWASGPEPATGVGLCPVPGSATSPAQQVTHG